MNVANLARLALRCLDLTSLRDDDSTASIEALAERADTRHGAPAALCVYPAFVATARRALDARGLGAVRVATVVNFPQGEDPPAEVQQAIGLALALGADEIDAVLPWRALRAGEVARARDLVAACRAACGRVPLKIILETGELQTSASIRLASEIALAEGADFLKTSTGKVAVNATPAAAAEMLAAIRAHGGPCGLKVAGGLATLADVASFLELASTLWGEAGLGPQRLRFGASSLLPVLLAALDGTEPAATPPGAY